MDEIDDILNDALGEAKQPDEPENLENMGFSLDREGYAWAADVYWVYEHMGGKMTRDRAGTSGRYHLWQYAKKNTEKFVGTVLPKAMALLEKARDKQGDAEIVETTERKSIREMKQILADALEEALGGGDA